MVLVLELVETAPPPELAPFIESVWSYAAPPEPESTRYAAETSVELILRVDRDGSATPFVSGPTAGFTEIVLPPSSRLFGARFHPGLGARLLGADARELYGRNVHLRNFRPVHARSLESRAYAAPMQEALALQALVASLARGSRAAVPPAVQIALQCIARGEQSVTAMARTAGIPERTLRREFTAAVGLPPKVVARIARVRRAQAAIARGQALSAIAAHHGFADQAHMTREFMELVGRTPRTCAAGALSLEVAAGQS